MAIGFFTSDTYQTDNNTTRFFLDRLMINTRWVFIYKYISLVLRSRRTALKGKYDTQAWENTSYESLKILESCGGKFHITGLDHIRQCKGPVVFVSNHMSTLETMVFPCIISPLKKVTFVVKESLVKHPLFGPVMRTRNPIIVSRSNLREDLMVVMKTGQELLAEGTSIVIFPQSTRKAEFVPAEFNSLGIKLADKAGVQVIPVAIKTDFWGNGKFLKELGPINRNKPIFMNFGEAITVGGSTKESHQKVIDFIAENISKWQNRNV
jgi:1-acyl-sn-glycerol-3-phosphate acyltransferase